VALSKYGSEFLYAYARSVITGREDIATRYFVIKET
jgi:hypothetical protein